MPLLSSPALYFFHVSISHPDEPQMGMEELTEGGQNCARRELEFYHLLLTSSLAKRGLRDRLGRRGVNWTIMGYICCSTIRATPQNLQPFSLKQRVLVVSCKKKRKGKKSTEFDNSILCHLEQITHAFGTLEVDWC